jgi:hypothetical protein
LVSSRDDKNILIFQKDSNSGEYKFKEELWEKIEGNCNLISFRPGKYFFAAVLDFKISLWQIELNKRTLEYTKIIREGEEKIK